MSHLSDLEITRLCAEAVGLHQRKVTDGGTKFWIIPHHPDPQCAPSAIIYDPITNDAQAMALEWLLIEHSGALHFYRTYLLFVPFKDERTSTFPYNDAAGKRRAICECVAKLQQAKTASTA